MSIHTFSFPTLIRFGPGARRLLGDALRGAGVGRPLLVTDRTVRALPFFEEISSMLATRGLAPAPFDEVWGNPVKSQVLAGVRSYRAHDADAVVGIGGGAALDVAKAIALLVHHPGDLFDYEDEKPHARPIDQPLPFFVAIPTTAGTGSEVGRSTVISDDVTHQKKIMFSPRLLAREVFADPELLVGLPAPVTAATGMDALTHLVESYLAKGFHPICDGVALEGLKLAARSLPLCVESPSDLDARGSMLLASLMGGIAFQKGLGLTHSTAHALSTVADLHHGLANGIMIPYALSFNAPAVPERFRTLAETVGLSQKDGEAFLRWLEELRAQIGIPRRLGDVRVTHDRVGKLTEVAFQDACHLNNPREVTAQDFARIFEAAM